VQTFGQLVKEDKARLRLQSGEELPLVGYRQASIRKVDRQLSPASLKQIKALVSQYIRRNAPTRRYRKAKRGWRC